MRSSVLHDETYGGGRRADRPVDTPEMDRTTRGGRHGSSVRLDSFVYTVEGLREARSRLKPDGIISLSFAVLSESLGRKIYLMLQEAFDGRAPLSIEAGYEGNTFLISNDPNWKPPATLVGAGINDITPRYADPSLQATVSTDAIRFGRSDDRRSIQTGRTDR